MGNTKWSRNTETAVGNSRRMDQRFKGGFMLQWIYFVMSEKHRGLCSSEGLRGPYVAKATMNGLGEEHWHHQLIRGAPEDVALETGLTDHNGMIDPWNDRDEIMTFK